MRVKKIIPSLFLLTVSVLTLPSQGGAQDAQGSAQAMKKYYEELKKTPGASREEQKALYRRIVAPELAKENREQAKRDAQAVKRTGRGEPPRAQPSAGPAPRTPLPPPPSRLGAPRPAPRPRAPAPQSTGTDPSYRGPVEGGTVSEVIEFPGGAPSGRAPSPAPSETLREKLRREAREKVKRSRAP
jgi:hypothetical protein